MATLNKIPGKYEKARASAEIDRQVTEFLSRDGKIEVGRGESGLAMSTVWHQQEELSKLV